MWIIFTFIKLQHQTKNFQKGLLKKERKILPKNIYYFFHNVTTIDNLWPGATIYVSFIQKCYIFNMDIILHDVVTKQCYNTM